MPIKYSVHADSAYFSCPKCNSPLETKLKNANLPDECPQCHQPFISPGADQAAVVPDEEMGEPWFRCPKCHHFKLFGGLCDKCAPVVECLLVKMLTEESPSPADVDAFAGRYELTKSRCRKFKDTAFLKLVDDLCSQINNASSEGTCLQSVAKYANALGVSVNQHQSARDRVLRGIAALRARALASADEARRQEDRRRLLAAISAGHFPNLQANFPLLKNEVLYFYFRDVTFKQVVQHTYKARGHRVGGSVRVMRGFWVNASEYIPGITTCSETLDTIDVGNLAISNQRVIFQSSKRSWTIKINKLVDTTAYIDAFLLSKESSSQNNKPYFLCYEDQELFNVSILAAMSGAG